MGNKLIIEIETPHKVDDVFDALDKLTYTKLKIEEVIEHIFAE